VSQNLDRRVPSIDPTTLDYGDIFWFLLAASLLGLLLHLCVAARWLSQALFVNPPVSVQGGVVVTLIFALGLILKIRRGGSPATALGWRPAAPRYFAFSLVGGFLMAVAVIVVVHGSYPLIPRISFAAGVLLAVALGPILEESLFRGFLLPVMSRSLGLAGAVIVTSLLFGLVHRPPTVLHYICFTLAGIGYAWIRVASKSTATAAVMHASYNLALLVAPRLGLH
jgi:membrane protease YdiL (CAAX protease family)